MLDIPLFRISVADVHKHPPNDAVKGPQSRVLTLTVSRLTSHRLLCMSENHLPRQIPASKLYSLNAYQ
jgi:hypothetical protein